MSLPSSAPESARRRGRSSLGHPPHLRVIGQKPSDQSAPRSPRPYRVHQRQRHTQPTSCPLGSHGAQVWRFFAQGFLGAATCHLLQALRLASPRFRPLALGLSVLPATLLRFRNCGRKSGPLVRPRGSQNIRESRPCHWRRPHPQKDRSRQVRQRRLFVFLHSWLVLVCYYRNEVRSVTRP